MCEGYQYFTSLGDNGLCYCAFELDSNMNLLSPDNCRKESNGRLLGNKNNVAIYKRNEAYDYKREPEKDSQIEEGDIEDTDGIFFPLNLPNLHLGRIKIAR